MNSFGARLLRISKWALIALLGLLLAATLAGLALSPKRADPSLAQRAAPPPAIDTAPGSAKPTLILLHGAGLNAHMWDAVIRHLDPRWRVIALDLPGHGVRMDEDYSVDAAARAVAAAAERAAPAPVILVGDSLGGYSAMAGAERIPAGRLGGLMVCGASAVIPARLGAGDWAKRLVFRLMLAAGDQHKLALKALARFGVAPADAVAIDKAGVKMQEVEIAVDALAGQDFRPRLARISRPILFCNGDGDVDRVAQEPSFIAAAPNASSYRFIHTGHGVSMVRPEEFATQLNAFAARTFFSGGEQGWQSP